MSLEWLIIGGGIHGVHLGARLIGEAGVPQDRIAIVDPADRLLSRWRSNTQVTGMRYLRSPAVHNLDLDPMSLHLYAGNQRHRRRGDFREPYARPALALFNAHCDEVVSEFGLAHIHLRDRAVSCIPGKRSVFVRLAAGGWLETHNLIFAMGMSEQPLWPDWAPQEHAQVHHIFAPGFNGWPEAPGERVTVIGGGISAAQVALRLLDEGHRVRLVTRHEFRERQFDSDPGWLGPRLRAEFDRQRKPSRRREIISEARHRGSMPADVSRPLKRAIQEDQITWDRESVDDIVASNDTLYVRFSNRLVVEADRVLLATGYSPQRPGGAMLDSLVESASLPVAKCGYPIVDASLRWHPNIYVTGPLAELEIGPVSRNIAGARAAGDRIMPTITTHHRPQPSRPKELIIN